MNLFSDVSNSGSGDWPWWAILLVVIGILIFLALVIWFSFVYPAILNKRKVNEILTTEPERIILNPSDVRYFAHYKYDDIEAIKNTKEIDKPGIYGLYVSGRIEDDDYIYPIYLQKTQNVKESLLTLSKDISLNDDKLEKLFDYLKRTNKDLNKVKVFYINDLNINKFDYFKNLFEVESKGFN